MSDEFILANHSHVFILVTSSDRRCLLTMAYKHKESPGMIVTVPSINFIPHRNWDYVNAVSKEHLSDYGVSVNDITFDRLSRKLYTTRDKDGNTIAVEHIYIGYQNLQDMTFCVPKKLLYDNTFYGMKWRTRLEIEKIFNGELDLHVLQVGLKEITQLHLRQDQTYELNPQSDIPREVDRRDIRSPYRLPEK